MHDSSGLRVDLEDLAVRYGFEQADESRYRWRLRQDGKDLLDWKEVERPTLFLSQLDYGALLPGILERSKDAPSALLQLEVQTRRDGDGWSKPLNLYFLFRSPEVGLYLAGIEHKD